MSRMIIPAIMPLLFFAVAATPVEVLGCRNRGLLALLISSADAVSALFTAVLCGKRRMLNDSNAIWWLISTLVLVAPVIALIVLA